ncbi:MAG: zinc-dependent metalloprotease, partial [Balneolaceae bacterium]
NFEPIIMSFDIEALSEDSSGVLIEIDDLFLTDVPAIGLQSQRRSRYRVRRMDSRRTFIEHIRSYPENVEARHLVTYEALNPPTNSATNAISLVINHSMLLLPEEPMQTRSHDERIGFFSVSQTDYGSGLQRAEQSQYITRWRLEPKDPEAYLRGELTEPKKPIVFYIDSATPKPWRRWLAKGVEDWQAAFEEAGFKKAIIARMAPTPEEDPDFSPEDARYSMIRYFASPVQNAYGPHVHDPRSGEIITSSIGWYHNVMNLLRNWYFVQTAAANPDARGIKFDEEVMGELIRFVSAHEVGHTLGLAHNFGSSHAFPVDSLRSPEFTDKHGTSPSIMDYARFNYIAQPGDGVTNFLPKVGDYDKWAIQWGYSWFGDRAGEEKRETLHSWIVERSGNQRYFYGRQTGLRIDPRSQNEDLGDDPVRAGEYGLANLKVITDNLLDWVKEDRAGYDHLEEIYEQIILQWRRYMTHALANVGGVYENPKTFDQDGAIYTPVPGEKQKQAVGFLAEHGFSSPDWIVNKDILNRTTQSGFVDNFREEQVGLLNRLMDPQRIARLIEYERRAENSYSPLEMMDDVREVIWSELDSDQPTDVYRRNLQRAYLDRMDHLMTNELSGGSSSFLESSGGTPVKVSQSDIRPIVRDQLEILLAEVREARGGTADRATRIHFHDVEYRIGSILDP